MSAQTEGAFTGLQGFPKDKQVCDIHNQISDGSQGQEVAWISDGILALVRLSVSPQFWLQYINSTR